MGIPRAGADDSSHNFLTGTFTSAIPAATSFRPQGVLNLFNVSVWGTFVATVTIERSFDGGTTWVNLSRDTAGTNNAFTAPFTMAVPEPEQGVRYRFNCTGFTSGTVNWRLSE